MAKKKKWYVGSSNETPKPSSPLKGPPCWKSLNKHTRK